MKAKHTTHTDLLSQVELFRGCTKKELAAIASTTVAVDQPAGAVLCRQGSIGTQAFVVVDGKAVVSIDGIDVADVGPGSFFGEMALLDGGPRVATVTAATPMQLLVLSRPEFNRLILDVPKVARRMLEAVGTRLRQVEQSPNSAPIGA
jgi:voltage-gated potassium channel